MTVNVVLPNMPDGDDINYRQMAIDIGDAILNTARLSFINSSTPHGDAWLRLSPATIKQRRGGSDSPLRDTGRLMNSLMMSDVYETSDGIGVDVGSNLVYANIHNFGGMAGRNRSVKIPQRQFMPDLYNMPPDLEGEIEDIMEYWTLRGIE